jgi:hypothetical protein
MVLVCFLHVFIAVVDRVIFVRMSRKDIEFDYIYYYKSTGEKVSPEEAKGVNLQNEHLYDVVYFQKEGPNYPLMVKYILHIAITVFIHLFIFYFLTMVGTYNLANKVYCQDHSGANECNDFTLNPAMIWFYILYCIFLYFSSCQLHFGLLDMRKKSLFMRGDNLFYSIMFKIYKAIPFIYELKITIDWSFTPSSLDLFKYMKFERVYDLLFLTHCHMKANNNKPVGEVVGKVSKVFVGGFSFVTLLIILIGPLLLFSSLNPSNIYNPVKGAQIELSFLFQIGRVTHTFNIFTNNYVESISDISENAGVWDTYGYENSSATRNFADSQVQVLLMSSTSDTIWEIARPHIDTIIYRLENYRSLNFTIAFDFKYSFKRNVSKMFNLYSTHKKP